MPILKKRFNDGLTKGLNEVWLLENSLRVSLFHGKDGNSAVMFSSDTGDVTNQIYEKLKSHKIYNDIKLITISSYLIIIAEAKERELLEIVEKLDISDLKEGLRY